MRAKILAGFLLLLSSACATTKLPVSQSQTCETGKPDECKVLDYVWKQSLNQTKNPPPVIWSSENCQIVGSDQTRTAVNYQGQCYSGLFLAPNEYKALVAWRGSFSSSAYTHELIHALQYLMGVYDPNHTQPIWQVEGTINTNLKAMGF